MRRFSLAVAGFWGWPQRLHWPPRRTCASPISRTSGTTVAATRRSRRATATPRIQRRTLRCRRRQRMKAPASGSRTSRPQRSTRSMSNKMTAGANDYCTVPSVGDAWAGFYYSSNKGATWANSLLPGYGRTRRRKDRPRRSIGSSSLPAIPCRTGIARIICTTAASRSTALSPGTVRSGSPGTTGARRSPRPTTSSRRSSRAERRPRSSRAIFEDKVELEADDGVDSPHSGQRLRLLGAVHRIRQQTTSSSSRARPTVVARGRRRRSPRQSTATRSATSP